MIRKADTKAVAKELRSRYDPALTVTLERIPEKLINFFDKNTLKLLEKRAISYRLGDSTQAESALIADAGQFARLYRYYLARDSGMISAVFAPTFIRLLLSH